ncbi:MAG: O-antigen ligase family protein, partial [Verrucomicrobiota bacterium]
MKGYLSQYPTRIGPVLETADRQEHDAGWASLFAVTYCGLFIPYLTSLIPAFYSLGVFPIRPAYFLLLLVTLNLALLLPKGPDYTKTSFLLLGIIAFRALDIGILQRYIYIDGQKEPFLSMIATTLISVVLVWSFGVLRKTSFSPVLMVAGAAICIQSVSVLLEFVGLIQFSTVSGRAAGLAGDANDSCMMITLLLSVFLTINKRFSWSLAMIGMAALGVLPTLSRGGFLCLLLIVGLFSLLHVRQHGRKLLLAGVAALPLFVLFASILLSKANSGPRQDENAKKRIEAMYQGNLEGLVSGERIKDLKDGLWAISQHPLGGWGTGAGQMQFQPHNQIITMWIDLGLIGPILFLGILSIAAIKVV